MPEMISLLKALGERLRTIRKLKNLTQTEVAQAAGLDVQYYNRLEKGKTNPTFITMSKVAAGLGVDSCPGFLYLGAVNAPPELAEICSCSAHLLKTGRNKELRQTRDFLEHVLGTSVQESCAACPALTKPTASSRKNPGSVRKVRRSRTR